MFGFDDEWENIIDAFNFEKNNRELPFMIVKDTISFSGGTRAYYIKLKYVTNILR